VTVKCGAVALDFVVVVEEIDDSSDEMDEFIEQS